MKQKKEKKENLFEWNQGIGIGIRKDGETSRADNTSLTIPSIFYCFLLWLNVFNSFVLFHKNMLSHFINPYQPHINNQAEKKEGKK